MIFGYTQITTTPAETAAQYEQIVRWAETNYRQISGIFSYPDIEQLNIRQLNNGDILLVSDLSRFGNSLQTIRDTLQYCLEHGITIIAVQDNQEITPGTDSLFLLQGIDLALGIRNRLLSRTTSKALAERKAAGATLGRRKNANIKKRLDGREAEIKQLLAKGISKSEIARRLNVSRVTLYKFMENNKLSKEIT